MQLLHSDSSLNPGPANQPPVVTTAYPQGKRFFLGAIVAGLALANVYLISKVEMLEIQHELLQSRVDEQMGEYQTASSTNVGQARRELEDLRQKIEAARAEAAGRAEREAQRRSDQVAKNLTQQQEARQQELLGGIHDVRSVAEGANSEIKVVRNDMLGIKAEVDDANAHLYETAALLDQTTDDISEISGLVTDNQTQLASLQRMTQRDRVRFQLTKSKNLQRVADIQLRLRATDVKRNKYSIEILADDKTFLKKDRQAAEPVLFYMGDGSQPYELVITKINKDTVSGYLAKPKVEMASR
jgi:chromosome segregation ATPase